MLSRTWLLLAAAVGARISFGMQIQSVGTVGPALVEAMDLTYVALGTLIGLYSLPGVAAALPGGWLVTRLGNRRMALASLALMITGGALMAVSQEYDGLLVGRLLSGTGSSMLSVVLPKVMLDHVPPDKVAGLMGTFIAGFPLGVALALTFLPLFGSWRLAMAACAVACAAAFIAAFIIIPEPELTTTASAPAFRINPGTALPLLLISLVWAFTNGCLGVFLGFAPSFFVAHGMSLAEAGSITSVSLYAGLPITPFGGWLLARTVGLVPGILLSLAGLTALPMLLLTDISPAVTMIAYGIFAGLCGGPIFALAGKELQPEERALAMGILFTIFYAVMAIAPLLAGLARDLTGNPAMPFFVGAASGIIAILAQIAHAFARRTIQVSPA